MLSKTNKRSRYWLLATLAIMFGCGAPAVDISRSAVQMDALFTLKIGEQSVLLTSDSEGANYLVAQSTALAQPATVQSLSFYVAQAAGNVRLGIYDASGPSGQPGKKKAETNSFAAKIGWNTANVVTQVILPAGNYWLAWLSNNNSLRAKRGASSGTSSVYYSRSFGTLPATFGTNLGTHDYHWSLYATLGASDSCDSGIDVGGMVGTGGFGAGGSGTGGAIASGGTASGGSLDASGTGGAIDAAGAGGSGGTGGSGGSVDAADESEDGGSADGGTPPVGTGIWWVSKQGSDSNTGRSINTAFATFHKALTSMAAGDTLYIDDGVYYDTIGAYGGTFSPWSTGEGTNGQSASARTRILGYRPHAVTVDGGYSRYPLFLFKGQHIEVGNIVFLHSALGYEPVHVEESYDVYLHQLGAAYPSQTCDNCTAIDEEASSNVTIEDCWTWGYGARYGVALHGGYQNVARRTVTRYDGSMNGQPKAGLVLYSEDQTVAENNITLDFDTAADSAGDVHAAFFTTSSSPLSPPSFPAGLPHGLGTVSWYGNMAINSVSTSEAVMFFDSLSSVGGTVTAVDNVLANGNAPFHSNGNSIGIWVSNDQGTRHGKISLRHNTVYNIVGVGVRIDDAPGWQSVEFNDNLVSNLSPSDSPCLHDVSGSCARITTSNNEASGCDPSEITRDAILSTQGPQLSYLARIEQGTPGYGSGTAGTNRGATVVNRYVGGVITGDSLWPFPNEDTIRQDMCAGPDGTLLNGKAINTRGHNASGWCASGKTLTKYVWEQLGNASPF